MRESNLPLALILLAVVFFVIAIVFLIKAAAQRRRFAGRAVGKVIEVKVTKEQYTRRSSNDDYRTGQRTWYAPTIEYTVGGKTYRSAAERAAAASYYVKGKEIEIYYSPKNPEKFTAISADNKKKGGLVMLGISAGLLLIGLLLSLGS